MSSTSAVSRVPPQQQLVPAIPAAASPPTGGRLSLEDISKYFNLPIADAATILGVCTSVLKRICRENGIIRWPYRKFLAGKTFDDIKKEAAREKSKELAGLSNTAKQNLDASKTMHSTSAGLSTFGNQVQNRALGHQGVSMPGNTLQPQGNKSFQHGWSSTVQNQTKHIPTYLDDFKHGFPSNGLASASTKWWGTSSIESYEEIDSAKSVINKEEKQEYCKLTNEPSSCMMIDEQTDSNGKDGAITTDPSAFLVSLRKRAVDCGRESIQVGLSNCESDKLGEFSVCKFNYAIWMESRDTFESSLMECFLLASSKLLWILATKQIFMAERNLTANCCNIVRCCNFHIRFNAISD